MIKLSRAELKNIARTYVLTNTPYSLLRALNASSAVIRMKSECSFTQLSAYYDKITAKARRSELTIGLSYAVLISLLTYERKTEGSIDPMRLRWGPALDEYVKKSSPSFTTLSINASPIQNPRIEIFQDTGRISTDFGTKPTENEQG